MSSIYGENSQYSFKVISVTYPVGHDGVDPNRASGRVVLDELLGVIGSCGPAWADLARQIGAEIMKDTSSYVRGVVAAYEAELEE